MTAVLVIAAGALGAALRYLVDSALHRGGEPRLRWATLVVNVSGSFALGLLVGAGPRWTAVAGTGLLGGYTTFSTYAVEAAEQVADGARRLAIVTTLAHVVCAMLAAAAGVAISG